MVLCGLCKQRNKPQIRFSNSSSDLKWIWSLSRAESLTVILPDWDRVILKKYFDFRRFVPNNMRLLQENLLENESERGNHNRNESRSTVDGGVAVQTSGLVHKMSYRASTATPTWLKKKPLCCDFHAQIRSLAISRENAPYYWGLNVEIRNIFWLYQSET